MRRSNDKQRFSQEFAKHVRELSRSSPYAGPLQSSQQISETFTQSIDEEKSRLDTVLTRLLACAEIIPTDAVILRDSLSHRIAFDLSAKDSIVFASVLTHLVAATGLKCFLTRNKGFDDPDVRDRLNAEDCRLIVSFADGLIYIERVLRGSP